MGQEPVTVSACADPHWTRQESNLKPPGVPGLCLVELLVLPAREDLKGWFELLFSLALQTGNQPRSLMFR